MTPTRKGLPPEAELIPSGSSPGWMKNLSFKEVYTNFDDGDTDQQEFLRTSHGDGSIFIDDYTTEGDFDEDIISSELLDDLNSRDMSIRSEALEKIMIVLKEDISHDRHSYFSNYQNVNNAICQNSFDDIRENFLSFQKSLGDIHKDSDSIELHKSCSDSSSVGEDFLEKIRKWHPTYFEKYIATYDFIMKADGPLPHHLRNYFAILSAARFRCHAIIKHQEQQFLLNGGDPTWLENISNASPKMQLIFDLNQILAHQPWMIKSTDIENILRGDHLWTLSELVHASVIMACFRSISSMFYGISVISEIQSPSLMEEEATIEKLCSDAKVDEKETKEQNQKSYEEAESEASQSTSQDEDNWDDMKHYIGNYTMKHQNFDVRSKDYDIYRFNEFTWGETGFEILQRYYNAASFIDDKFKEISNLTYHKVRGKEGIDTGPFRRALWNYAHRLQGIEHDDYTYSLVNKLMDIPMKSFVKKLVCKPEQIKPCDIQYSSFNIYPDEICHIIILAAEARLQGELIYLLRAITRYLSFT